LHQPLIGGVQEGSATDLAIEAAEIIRLRKLLYKLMADRTGRDENLIAKDCDRNLWLDAEQAIDYGLVDKVLERMPEPVARRSSE
jgi:ATP-dependent Clp protease protease subunit